MSPQAKRLSKDARAFGRRQGPPRRCTIGLSVTTDEQAQILRALARAGFPSASVGARTILLQFACGEAA